MTIRGHSTFNNPTPVSTTSATAVQALLIDVVTLGVNNCGFRAEGVLIGKETSTNKVVSLAFSATFGVVSGTLTQHGSTGFSGNGDASLTTCVPTLAVSANKVQLTVAGVAGKTITWTAHLDIFTAEQ